MNQVTIELEGAKTLYLPGDTVRGTAQWNLAKEPGSAQVKLIWFTRGKGTQDVGEAGSVDLGSRMRIDQRSFELAIPEGPYSFSGKLISLSWAVELVVGSESTRAYIVISPTEQEITLGQGT